MTQATFDSLVTHLLVGLSYETTTGILYKIDAIKDNHKPGHPCSRCNTPNDKDTYFIIHKSKPGVEFKKLFACPQCAVNVFYPPLKADGLVPVAEQRIIAAPRSAPVEIISADEAAALAGMSGSTYRNHVLRGIAPGTVFGPTKSQYAVVKSELLTWLEKKGQAPALA